MFCRLHDNGDVAEKLTFLFWCFNSHKLGQTWDQMEPGDFDILLWTK